jgi:hypothetical protein
MKGTTPLGGQSAATTFQAEDDDSAGNLESLFQ